MLSQARDILRTAQLGLEDLKEGRSDRRLAAFQNVVVFGRAVTNALEHLRTTEPKFDEWYAKYRSEMESDPLMRIFYEMRSEILKEGRTRVSNRLHIKQLQTPADMKRFGPPPPNAKALIIGDRFGGTGWEIQLPDGSTEMYYVGLPSDIGTSSLVLQNPPKEHLGQPLIETSIQACSALYIGYLEKLVVSAAQTFGK